MIKKNDIEKSIEQQENQLMLLFKNMINAFALVLFHSVFDESGNFISYRFIYINDAYEKITGVKIKEVKGKTVHEVLPEIETEWVEKYGKVVNTGKSDSFEMFYKPTNKLYWCNVYRPFTDKTRFCVIFEDITDKNKQSILVVEDREFNYLFIEETLIDRNVKIIHAKDGRQAIKIFMENSNINLVLMDIKLPEMSGDKAAKIIKQMKPSIPIVAQSAFALQHEIVKFKRVFDDYLAKPIKEK